LLFYCYSITIIVFHPHPHPSPVCFLNDIKVVETVKKQENVDTWVIIGIESHVCVQQTVLGLLEMDKHVFVLADAVSSQYIGDRYIALERMRQV